MNQKVKTLFNLEKVIVNFYSYNLGGMPIDVLKTENSCNYEELKNVILIVPGM